ncbi:MAG: hypothetical protein QXH96_01060 [Candidatus Geothermarchaeota archaeon]
MRLFGTSGIRGILGKDLTLEKIFKIGLAIGTYYEKENKTIVGWDCRRTSASIVTFLTGILTSLGIHTELCGLVTTPALQKYIFDTRDYDFGLIITASHNPPEYNGIKLIDDEGFEATEQLEDAISKIFDSNMFRLPSADNVGKVKENSLVVNHYIESLIKHLNEDILRHDGQKIKVLLDHANCTTLNVIPKIVYKTKKLHLVNTNSLIDGHFPNRPSEPKPENLIKASNLVNKYGFDIGLAFDGDGDRAILIDDEGVAWWGDVTGTLIATYLTDFGIKLKSVVTPVTSSSIVEIVLEEYSIKTYRTKVGAKHIVAKMKETNSILGFEENGGVIFAPHLYARDGGIALILLINLIHHWGKKLSKLLSNIPRLIQVKDKIVLTKNVNIHELLMNLESALSKNAFNVEMIDGIKVFYDIDRWVLIRPSGTEPVIRVFVESNNLDDAINLLKTAKALVNKYICVT